MSAFLIADNGGKTISSAMGRIRPELKSPFVSLTPIRYTSGLEFFGYLLPFKSYVNFFRLACKMPFGSFGEGIFCREKNYLPMRPLEGIFLAESTSFDA
jgi:hypothetical protein